MILILDLISTNFPSWKKSFLLAIVIRNKQGFLDGAVIKPSLEDPLYLSWIHCNNLIVAWLLKLVSHPIASTIFYMENAKQIWEKLHQRFLQSDNTQICLLQHIFCVITQGTKSVMPISQSFGKN
ncbi:hypothetical protein P3X46_032496 [Hevea brasiliensis]|uniref:Retrotransposon Copia-like N-terminal domain-containing protein n=1 Tax=Hevea brasiliensis TaxID=3981 RepID=A0ABQ9KEZ5_HEVBR|nr:hypothetical protein P3X46_032496 [Hevea brasiliensis]